MPSRKQRRRREKQQRHEWEEVYVDEEGRELAAEEAAELEPTAASGEARDGHRAARTKQPTARSGRDVDPPSWRRTFRRGLLFFPLMLLTIFLLAGDEITTVQKVVQTLVLMAFFLPFSYFMDSSSGARTSGAWRRGTRRRARRCCRGSGPRRATARGGAGPARRSSLRSE